MNRVKLILSYLFGFITSVLLSLLVILLLCKYSILNENYIKNVLGKNNYYSEVYEGTLEEMKTYMISSGLEEDILDEIITESEIEKEVNKYIDSIYDNTEYKVDSESVRNKLTTNIDKYLNDNNLDVENRKELNMFINDMIKIYEDEIKFYNIGKFGKEYINIANIYIDNIIYIIFSVSLVLIIILILLKNKFISSSLLSSGLILLFIRFVIYEKIDIKNILIVSEYFSKSLKTVLYELGHNIFISSILLISIGLIIALIESIKFKGKKKKIKNRKIN